jgi:DNA-directed RNA polymerase subunit RPC12/RpoP
VAEIPTKAEPGKAGQKYRGVGCKGCGLGIRLEGDLGQMLEGTQIRCPRCGHSDRYGPHDIRTLLAQRPQ